MSFGNDWNWIVAGLVSSALLVGLSVFAGVHFAVSLIAAALVFAGLVFLLAPRRLFEGLDLGRIGQGRIAFARDLLVQAGPAAEKLTASAGRIADKDMQARIKNLSDITADIMARVEQRPENAGKVRRFLTYYLPQAAEVAAGYAVLEGARSPNRRRLDDVGAVIAKLQDGFAHYADSLAESELGTLDVDLKLIQASLKEDIGR